MSAPVSGPVGDPVSGPMSESASEPVSNPITDPAAGGRPGGEAHKTTRPRQSLAQLAGLYALFGVIATGCNIAAQALSHTIWAPAPGVPDLAYWWALGLGTGVGLVVKYLLDKRWIFFDREGGVAAHSKKFGLYTLMGAATTVIFWGMQTGFFLIWQSEAMLYLGGALGLAIGYVVKYQLDKRFVFGPRAPAQPAGAAP